MLTNDDIVRICNLVRNKQLEGEDVTTAEFQTLINSNSQKLFTKLLGVPDLFQPNMPIERRGVGVSRVIDTKLRPFLTTESLTVAGGTVDFTGKNVAYMDAITQGKEYVLAMGASLICRTTRLRSDTVREICTVVAAEGTRFSWA